MWMKEQKCLDLSRYFLLKHKEWIYLVLMISSKILWLSVVVQRHSQVLKALHTVKLQKHEEYEPTWNKTNIFVISEKCKHYLCQQMSLWSQRIVYCPSISNRKKWLSVFPLTVLDYTKYKIFHSLLQENFKLIKQKFEFCKLFYFLVSCWAQDLQSDIGKQRYNGWSALLQALRKESR